MSALSIEEKRKIDGFILDVACSMKNHISARYVARNIHVGIDKVRKRLLDLADDDKLIPNYEIVCHNCYHVIKTYHNNKDIKLNEELYCENSDTDIIVEPSNIFINFTPNKEYYKSEICKKKTK